MKLIFSGWRPGMFLSTLQSTGQHPTTKNYLAQDFNSAKVEKLIRNNSTVLSLLLQKHLLACNGFIIFIFK